MERLRIEYEAGDKSALALALYGCARFRKPLPSWVAEAWQGGLGQRIDAHRRLELTCSGL